MDTEYSQIRKVINIVYYALYALYVLLIAVFGFWFKPSDHGMALDPLAQPGQSVAYCTIVYVIASVPGALWWFKKQMKRVSRITDERMQHQQYTNCAVARVLLIGIGAALGIVSFYFLGAYQPMLWCAAIAVIAQYFCKPTDRKIYLEMNNKNEEDL